jgi:hypothetical protein
MKDDEGNLIGMQDGERVGPFIFRIYNDRTGPIGALEYHRVIEFTLTAKGEHLERVIEVSKHRLLRQLEEDLKRG